MGDGIMIISEDGIHINDIPKNEFIQAEVVIPCSDREIAIKVKRYIINLQKIAEKQRERMIWLAQWLTDNEKHTSDIHITYCKYLEEMERLKQTLEDIS